MKAKLAIAPIAWSNDDLPELGGDTPLETCLRESRAAGFSGVETGGKFPKTIAALRDELTAHDLQLASGWYSGTVLDAPDDLSQEKDKVAGQLALFSALGAACLAYGETAGTIQNRREAPLNTRRRLSEDEIRVYGRRLTRFAEHCADAGVPLAFHHHMGTAIESEHDVDLLMQHTGEAVGLLYDAGHLAFAGGDVLRVIEKHGSRIVHVHAKDVRLPVIDSLDRGRDSFLDAVLAGAFTVPGDGSLDFGAIVRRIADTGYEGWFVVEAEQDPAKAPPAEYAVKGYEALSRALTGAGYTIEGHAA
ncbi:inosose dehydratase [Pseudochelatococcus lubricantis]|uniref:Inosose dehydratase n=1 Tax=Pseudochelatococcus lubricantis TaxID=1538102 RepID=A0ABX0UYK3_9HYPH|nr:myo-inosose-2 dehydratase [Pseudochelatococcus lubricantis]NIJ58031.1 inosose dehydratase [Pseudochelatococcus lubricantis]